MGRPSSRHVPFEITRMVRDTACAQGQARAIGRIFDDAFRPYGLTNFQFSLLMMLNRPSPPTIGGLAENLAMDRTTITANVKPLERRGLVSVNRDDKDSRVKLVTLTTAGRSLLTKCVKDWQAVNDAVRSCVSEGELASLYSNLDVIAEVRP
jgi:DNA-binding MarR family transcriptional regulator